MKRCLRFVALSLWSLLTLPTHAATPPDFTADRCPLVDELTPADKARVRCGMLRVRENPANPKSRTIELAVAIVEPKLGKGIDPVVMIHGGPGGGDFKSYRFRLNEPFGPRTLVIFDQRGVGNSRPSFCPELGDAIFEASVRGLSADAETAELVLAHRRCHDRLIAEGVDLEHYNTDATVADIEDIRTALGFETWKVYGISYGTAVGLAYLRDHPKRIKALVLDSVYPLDAPPASDIVPRMMQSLAQLSASCARDPACKARFGNLETQFQEALEGLVREPLPVPPLGATADWSEPVRVSAPAFLTVVQQLLYDAGAYPILPFLIERIAARDGEAFALLVDNFRERANGITHGAYAAVECYERFPFDSRDAFDIAAAPWPLVHDNMTLIARHFDICANWSEKAREPMRMPGRTAVPTLVTAGSWDPITPASTSKRVAEELGAHYVELPFHGHGVRGDKACGQPIIRAFLDDPSRAPNAACTRSVRAPVFATSLVRAPRVAQEVAALAANPTPAAAPAGVTLAGSLAFMAVSMLIWSFVGLTRALRLGQPAWAGLWSRPGAPFGLAALALCAAFGGFVWSFLAAAGTVSPILLMIGLPATVMPAFVLSVAGAALLIWGAVTLLRGREVADRPLPYSIHLWLFLAAGLIALFFFWWFGLMIPDLI